MIEIIYIGIILISIFKLYKFIKRYYKVSECHKYENFIFKYLFKRFCVKTCKSLKGILHF